jgi:hypothetical protein
MNPGQLAGLLALGIVVAGTPLLARLPDRAAGDAAPWTGERHQAVDAFLAAVDRGELQVFGRKLDRSMIVPRHVEYVYAIGNAIPVIKVYATLKSPITAPEHKNCEVRAVSAVLGADDQIVDTEAHVWPK